VVWARLPCTGHGFSAFVTQKISYKQNYFFKNWKRDKISSDSITQSHQECMKKITRKVAIIIILMHLTSGKG